MSVTRRPGATATPLLLPDTVVSTVMVRSRSVPVTSRASSVTASRTPPRTGSAPTAAGHGPPCCAQGFDQDVTLASKLHRSALPASLSLN